MANMEKGLDTKVIQHDEYPVDSLSPKEIQEDLRASRLNGWIPATPEEKAINRALNRKLDFMLMGFCALIYIFQGLDRSNLGAAETGGLTDDLGLPKEAINTAATLFFATYIPLAPFSTILGKKVGQPLWLGIISLLWGVVTLATAWVKTEQQLNALRLLLGVFETGLYPTVMSYLTIFYPRYDIAFRVALFYSCYAIATAFGGLIAYGTFKIGGSMHPWQWLFIIEGSMTIAIALATPFWLPKEPGTAWFLSESQRAFAVRRMKIDSEANVDDVHKITMRDIKAALCDWKLWGLLAPNICQGVTPLGLTIFFPIVVKVSTTTRLPTPGFRKLPDTNPHHFVGSGLLWAKRKPSDDPALCPWLRRSPSRVLLLRQVQEACLWVALRHGTLRRRPDHDHYHSAGEFLGSLRWSARPDCRQLYRLSAPDRMAGW